MTLFDIDSAQTSDMTNRVSNIEIEAKQIDGAGEQKETAYINSNWGKQLGIYKTIPEFKIALDMRAIWTIGQKVECTPDVEVILDHISGWGKDTFRGILKNMLITKRLGQDSFAEIMRDDENGEIINLKPLDPSTIRQVYDRKGIILRYEKIARIGDRQKTEQRFEPEEIFHLTNNRIADEIHGTADSDALKSIIEANNESFKDVRLLMHRWVKPIMKFIMNTSDTAKIAAYALKMDRCVDLGENIYLPKDTVDHEVISVPGNATLNPLPWREHLKNYFFQVVGIPQIIMGSSGEFTESTAKIAYVAFQNSVMDEQIDVMEQIWDQLGLKVKLNFSNPLRNELISELRTDEKKDGAQGMEFQPQDMTAGAGE